MSTHRSNPLGREFLQRAGWHLFPSFPHRPPCGYGALLSIGQNLFIQCPCGGNLKFQLAETQLRPSALRQLRQLNSSGWTPAPGGLSAYRLGIVRPLFRPFSPFALRPLPTVADFQTETRLRFPIGSLPGRPLRPEARPQACEHRVALHQDMPDDPRQVEGECYPDRPGEDEMRPARRFGERLVMGDDVGEREQTEE